MISFNVVSSLKAGEGFHVMLGFLSLNLLIPVLNLSTIDINSSAEPTSDKSVGSSGIQPSSPHNNLNFNALDFIINIAPSYPGAVITL